MERDGWRDYANFECIFLIIVLPYIFVFHVNGPGVSHRCACIYCNHYFLSYIIYMYNLVAGRNNNDAVNANAKNFMRVKC